MTRYELYLLAPVAAAILWIGGGLMLLLTGVRARSANDDDGMRRAISTTAALGTTYFIPASLAVLALLKPTGDDVGTLLVLAVVLVAGAAWVLARARSVEAPEAG